MKLIFLGTSDFSKPVFEALKKDGYSPILWNGETIDDFKKLEPDVCVVAAYGKIISKEWLEVPKYGFLNVHPSLLPKYRGASPIQTAILNGDKETGVTIILMDEKMDHGPVITNKKLKIKNQNYKELEKELAELGAELLIEILPKWVYPVKSAKGGAAKQQFNRVNGEIKPNEQNHDEATYTKKFSWPDGKIDWQKSAEEIDRQIRALNPEPGTWTTWGGKILKISEALPIPDKNDNLITGRVFLTKDKQAAIRCGFQSVILPKIVQLESKKPMELKGFLNGRKDFINSVLK